MKWALASLNQLVYRKINHGFIFSKKIKKTWLWFTVVTRSLKSSHLFLSGYVLSKSNIWSLSSLRKMIFVGLFGQSIATIVEESEYYCFHGIIKDCLDNTWIERYSSSRSQRVIFYNSIINRWYSLSHIQVRLLWTSLSWCC